MKMGGACRIVETAEDRKENVYAIWKFRKYQEIIINPINKLKKESRVIRKIQILDRTFPFKILIKISTKRFVNLNIFLILFYAR